MPHVHSPAARARRHTRALQKGFVQRGMLNCRAEVPKSSDIIDPLQSHDPWERDTSVTKVWNQDEKPASGWDDLLPPCVPQTPVQTNMPDLSAPLWLSMQGLIDSQNATIAALTCELQSLRARLDYISQCGGDDAFGVLPLLVQQAVARKDIKHAQDARNPCSALGGDVSVPALPSAQRLEKMEADIKKLSGTLGKSVQQAVESRVEKVQCKILENLEKEFYRLLRPHVDGLITPLINGAFSLLSEEMNQKVSNVCSVHIPDLLKRYDERVQKLLSKICVASKDTLERPTPSCEDARELAFAKNDHNVPGSHCSVPSRPSCRDSHLPDSGSQNHICGPSEHIACKTFPAPSSTALEGFAADLPNDDIVPDCFDTALRGEISRSSTHNSMPASSRGVPTWVNCRETPKLSCDEFLKMVSITRSHLPHLEEETQPMPMIKDGFHDPDSDADDGSVDSELPSEHSNDRCLNAVDWQP